MKAKIGIISAFPPCEKTAGENYTKQLIEKLAKIYDIKLIYFDYPGHDISLEDIKNIFVIRFSNSFYQKVFNSLIFFFIHPLFSNRFNIFRLLSIRKELKDCDIIYLNFSQVFMYASLFPNKKKILMVHDVILQKYSRKKGILGKLLSMWAYVTEKLIFNLPNTYIFCLSEKDRLYLASKYGRKAYVAGPFINEKVLNIEYTFIEVKNAFCFFGAWSRYENSEGLEWFLDNVMPFLSKDVQLNKLEIYIIGDGLPTKIVNKIQKYSNIRILGFMENPYYIIAQSKGLLAPIFQGAGVKFKVIESLCCGTPVIGTQIAFEGIDFDGRFLLLAETPEDYVRHIKKLVHITKAEKEIIRKKAIEKYTSNNNISLLKQLLGDNI